MPPPTTSQPCQVIRQISSSMIASLVLLCFLINLQPLCSAELDSAGKSITFYPSSLMMSHNVRPLIFYSETKLMHLVTKLKAMPPGPPLEITNNCSLSHSTFFGRLLDTMHNTQKIMNRLLSLSSFSNLLECDSYLRRYYTYATGLSSRMVCPRYYQPSLAACKTWALQNCRDFSPHERMFLSQKSRTRRSSYWCHAGVFGLFRKIYTALGHSCETDHVSNLKDTLRKLVSTARISQSMIHVLNGKTVYILRATDALTTKLNRLSQDMRVIDKTFSTWQTKLNEFAAENQCHESLLLEFLSKHANSVNRAFASLLRLTEIQDVLHQFSTVETKTLFGFPHLPPFLHPQITSRLATLPYMKFTSQALKEGFPLFVNPMVDIEHAGNQIESSILLTIPVVPDLNGFCTLEYLTPVKIQSSDTCYSGPVTTSNLVLLTCPNSQQIVTTEALNKCYHDSTAFICPTNVLTVASNISWLGFPFNFDVKLTFPRHHVIAKDCNNLHPLLHLGGRTYLATTTTALPLSSGTIMTSPLSVYKIPCNVSLTGMATGVGRCPDRLSVSVPLVTASSVQFVPWAAAVNNYSAFAFDHKNFVIPAPEQLNKTVLADLDATFTALDGQLSTALADDTRSINSIHETSSMGLPGYLSGFALAFSLISCLGVISLTVLYRRSNGHRLGSPTTRPRCRCGRLTAGERTTCSDRPPTRDGSVDLHAQDS